MLCWAPEAAAVKALRPGGQELEQPGLEFGGVEPLPWQEPSWQRGLGLGERRCGAQPAGGELQSEHRALPQALACPAWVSAASCRHAAPSPWVWLACECFQAKVKSFT